MSGGWRVGVAVIVVLACLASPLAIALHECEHAGEGEHSSSHCALCAIVHQPALVAVGVPLVAVLAWLGQKVAVASSVFVELASSLPLGSRAPPLIAT